MTLDSALLLGTNPWGRQVRDDFCDREKRLSAHPELKMLVLSLKDYFFLLLLYSRGSLEIPALLISTQLFCLYFPLCAKFTFLSDRPAFKPAGSRTGRRAGGQADRQARGWAAGRQAYVEAYPKQTPPRTHDLSSSFGFSILKS